MVDKTMTLKDTYTSLFSRQVVEMVKSNDYLSEVECEPLVAQWVKGVKEEHRPSVTSITMKAKRQLWNLVEI